MRNINTFVNEETQAKWEREIIEQSKKINLNIKSRSFPHLLKRAVKLKNDWWVFCQSKNRIISNKKGFKEAFISYNLLNIQGQVILHDRPITIPSINVLAISSGSSRRYVQQVIEKLVKDKAITLNSYLKLDEATGEVKTKKSNFKDGKVSNSKIRIASGKLRQLINPYSDDQAIMKKAQTNREYLYSLTTKSEIGKKVIDEWINRQSYIKSWDEELSKPEITDEPVIEQEPEVSHIHLQKIDDEPWALEL